MNLSWAKITVILLIIVIFYTVTSSNLSRDNQEELKLEINQLKKQTIEQQQKMEQLSNRQIYKLNIQSKEVKNQSLKIDQQINKLDEVTKNLEEKQQLETEIFEENQKRNKEALKATYLSQGFMVMSSLKVAISEYYMKNGAYPNNNEQIGASNPLSFANDVIKSAWVTGKGKITIIYTIKSGIEKGTLNFAPKEKNNQISWSCTTRDYKFISKYFPECKYL